MSRPSPQAAPGARASASVPGLGDDDFEGLRALVHRLAGIALGDGKRQLMASRLARRLRALNLPSYAAYLRHLEAGHGGAGELEQFVNCLTTNKTDFFREPHHFDFLREVLLQRRELAARGAADRRLRIWCAAASTGEEPYTLAMTVLEALGAEAARWDVRILASDIDTQVLAHAAEGLYDDARLAGVPQALRMRHFAPDPVGRWRVRARTREAVTFRRINLVDESWPVRARYDAIFCRNVSIYFDRPTQDRLFRRLADQLRPGGHLYVGHAEALHWMADRLRPVHPTVYQVRDGGPASGVTPRRGAAAPPRAGSTALARASREVSAAALPVQPVIVGGVFAAGVPAEARTVVGSCVSVCLFDPQARVGGMNHFLLPGEGAVDPAQAARFGCNAMEQLLDAVTKEGAERGRLQAKVFGGAAAPQLADPDIGPRNVAFARELLAREGIPVVSERVGGDRGLEVSFHTHTGRAFVRPVRGEAAAGAHEVIPRDRGAGR